MACSGSFPPPSIVDGKRRFWSSSSQGVGLGSSRGSDGTLWNRWLGVGSFEATRQRQRLMGVDGGMIWLPKAVIG
jgi:hypothetical protein